MIGVSEPPVVDAQRVTTAIRFRLSRFPAARTLTLSACRHARFSVLALDANLDRKRPDVDRGIVEQVCRSTDVIRRNRRQIALDIDHPFNRAVGIDPQQRFMDTV